MAFYHPFAEYSLRWDTASADGNEHGQQCAYDQTKRLFTDGLSAGTPDLEKASWTNFYNLEHYYEDVLSYGNDGVNGVYRQFIDWVYNEKDYGVLSCETYLDVYPPNKGYEKGFKCSPVSDPVFNKENYEEEMKTRSCGDIIDSHDQ